MSQEWSQIINSAISATPPTIAALAALVVAIRTKQSVGELHVKVNGRIDELVDLKAKALADRTGEPNDASG